MRVCSIYVGIPKYVWYTYCPAPILHNLSKCVIAWMVIIISFYKIICRRYFYRLHRLVCRLSPHLVQCSSHNLEEQTMSELLRPRKLCILLIDSPVASSRKNILIFENFVHKGSKKGVTDYKIFILRRVVRAPLSRDRSHIVTWKLSNLGPIWHHISGSLKWNLKFCFRSTH